MDVDRHRGVQIPETMVAVVGLPAPLDRRGRDLPQAPSQSRQHGEVEGDTQKGTGPTWTCPACVFNVSPTYRDDTAMLR